MEGKKTKKKKCTSINKKHLWNQFENEINPKSKIECLYRKCGEREFCENCNHSLAFTDEGFLTCTNNDCGIIYKDVIDSSAEWRFYGVDDNSMSDPTRCGMPINPLLLESSYGCRVINSSNASYEMRKIRRYTEWQSMPYKEKSQYDEFQHITMMANNAGISKYIIEDAIRYHKKISEHRTFRGINRDGIIAASIYVAFRINKTPRTPKEIANIFNLDNTGATRGCKNALSIINVIEENLTNDEKTDFGKTNPESFIERYCSKLNINKELTKLCQFIAKIIETKNYIPENTPHSIAAGIIFYVSQKCNVNISKKDVHTTTEISEVTINKCFKKLENLEITLIPKSIMNKYK